MNYGKTKVSVTMTHAQFLRYIRNGANRNNILRTRIILPRIGGASWGKIKVELKYEPTKKPIQSKQLTAA